MKKIELTTRELNKKLGEARLEGYELGKKECMYPYNRKKSTYVSQLVTALEDIFDERYEFRKGE